MSLCLMAGGDAVRDPDAFRESMTMRQFAEWMAYYGIEPWDGYRADVAAGYIASTMANLKRDPKRTPEPYKISDFMHDWTGERDEEDKPTRMSEDEKDASIGAWQAVLRANKREKNPSPTATG